MNDNTMQTQDAAQATGVKRASQALGLFANEAWGEAQGWWRQHSQIGLVGLTGALLLAAGGAFAVATPVMNDVTVQQVVEVVQPATSYTVQEDALRSQPLTLYRHTETRDSDTAGSLLARLGASDGAAEAYIRKTDAVRTEVLGLKMRQVQAEVDADKKLVGMTVTWLDPDQPRQYRQLVLKPTQEGFVHEVTTGDAEMTAAFADATVLGTYQQAVSKAGIPVNVANQLQEIFEPQLDISAQVRKGDHMTVVYERLSFNGQELGAGRLLSASVQVQGQPYQAVWFEGSKNSAGRTQAQSEGRYYTPAGEGLGLAYLPSPVPGAAITSPFEPYRIHPVFGGARAHVGIDYGATTGTPIHTVADGTVSFAGVQTGYGNVVIVQHGGKQSTLYAHMSHMDVKVGEKVRQGQVIGKVGSTGWATGPHLHFETHDKDVPQDPEVVLAERKATSVAAEQRTAFNSMVASAQRTWGQAQSVQTASAN